MESKPKRKNEMKLEKILELGGVISFDDISQLNQNFEVGMLINDLKEDLFQAVFPNQKIIDIGCIQSSLKSAHLRFL